MKIATFRDAFVVWWGWGAEAVGSPTTNPSEEASAQELHLGLPGLLCFIARRMQCVSAEIFSGSATIFGLDGDSLLHPSYTSETFSSFTQK